MPGSTVPAMIFTRAAVTALAIVGLTAFTATAAQAAAPKRHYIGHCQAAGDYPICSIDARTAYDVRHIYIHVWGRINLESGGQGRIEADVSTLCDRGTGSGDDSATYKAYPAYLRTLPQAYTRPSDCYSSAEISPVSFSASGRVYASMYYTRRDGK